ncbi:hypothetical protein ABFX02_09G052500 [Erythranthe guttata]
MAVVPSLMDSLFQRSIDDVIKGLRLCPPGTESIFISKSLDEIRREIKSTDPQTKATALHKLTYLHSLHSADMSWAAFHSVELSSSSAHSYKRVAFLSASLSFNPSTTQVILLLTHQLRKDLSSANPHDVSLALSTLSAICNPDLARDLTPDVFALLASGKPFVRKKAIAAVLRVFEQYPDAVRVCFKRVVENLESDDMGILSAVVGLFCELTEKEPRSYLPLAPEFYKILVDCRNNWVLIKVIKIFAKLAPLEPRLGKRVVEPICDHMARTGAKSLAFECVRMIVTSLSEYDSAVKLAVAKLREFLLEDDPNLKYLGLQGLTIVSKTNMWAVLENKELVVKALSDVDVNIKVEALRLVMCMVSEDNVMEISRILISQALKSDPEFCNEILGHVLLTCSRNFYEVVFDFDWYVSFLGEMARIPHCRKGNEIENQLVDIGMRVKDARVQLVHIARELVIDPALLGNSFIHGVLGAAAWVSGEYIELSRNPFEIMEALLQPRTSLLTPSVRAVYIQSAFKVLTFCLSLYLKLSVDTVASQLLSDTELDNGNGNVVVASSSMHRFTKESFVNLMNLVETNLGPLAGSNEVEVQERASNVLGLIKLIKLIVFGSEGDNVKGEVEASEMVKLIFDAFSEDLGPVSVNAQERVPIPDGLVLKENLGDLDDICGGDTEFSLPSSFSIVKLQKMDAAGTSDCTSKEESETLTESTSLLAEHRKRHGLYYLSSENAGTVSNDYPPAIDPKDKDADEAEDLARLTEESLVIKKKPNQARIRPVVVKLDDGEGFNVSAKKREVEGGDLISGAVQEVLLGNEATATSSSSRKRESSKKSRERNKQQHGHGKERKSQSTGKDKEHDGQGQREKPKRKSRQRGDGGALPAQLSVIPDFLL